MLGESVKFSDISADTAAFPLLGGRYAFAVVASFSSTVALQALGPDGSTYLDIKAIYEKADGTGGTADPLKIASLAADGALIVDLAPGMYKIAVDSSSGVYATVTRIPVGG